MPRRYSLVALALCAVMVAASWVVVERPSAVRAAAQVLTVNTTNDVYPSDGVCDSVTPNGCTLRDALEVADTLPVSTTVQIDFKMPLNDPGRVLDPITGLKPWFIRPVASYNFITRDNLTLDGFTQQQVGVTNPNGPIVVIDGTNLNASLVPSGSAFVFSGSGNLIRGLAIINYKTVSNGSETFNGIGLEFTNGSNNNTVQGCYIGVDAFGRAAAPNTIGITVRSNGNTIGGDRTRQDQRNVISGNLQTGILIDGNPAPIIGDASSGANNKIYGNFIGLNGFGTAAVANGGSGVFIRRGSGNLIGTPDDPSKTIWVERNTISGNGEHGIYIQDSKANKIYGNWIGTDGGGTEAFGNTRDGIHIESTGGTSVGNLIGGRTNPYMRNTISGNGRYAVYLQGDRTSGTVIQSNLIGPAASGFALTGSFTQAGIRLDTGVDGTLIGGTTGPAGLLPGQGNLIAGNKGDALVVDGSPLPNFITTTDGVTIQGNNIGVSEPSGLTGAQSDLANQGRSLVVLSAKNVTIGATGEGLNVIGNSTGSGIQITSVLTASIVNNRVGLKIAKKVNQGGSGGYTVTAPNSGDGISVSAAANVTIDSNIIGGNTGYGINVTSALTTTIKSNSVGGATAPDNKSYSLPNGQFGVRVSGGGDLTSLLVTYGTTLKDNKILNNTGGGVRLTNTYTSTLDGNTINLNAGIGVQVDGGGFNTQITAGTIYSNTVGILVAGDTQRVNVKTSISGNGVPPGTNTVVGDNRKAIILAGSVVPDGSSSAPNHDIDPPFNLRMNQAGRLTGQIRVPAKNQNPAPAGSCSPCTLRFYTPNPKTLDGQGKDEFAGLTPTIDTSGYFTATLGSVPPQVIVTATDAKGSTSEPAVFTPNYQPLQISPAKSGTASPGDTVRYTHWITNVGNIDLDDIVITTYSTKKWTTATAPPFVSPPLKLRGLGGSQAITLTVTLPSGGTPTVWAGNVDKSWLWARSSSVTTATATVTDTTTVIGKFTLSVTPSAPSALGLPGSTVSQAFSLQNTGNLTGTSTITATSFLVGPGGTLFTPEATRAAGWTTTLTPTSIPLIPGQARASTVFVGIPSNAQSGQKVLTRFAVTITSPAPVQTYYYTATTTVADKIQISLFPSRAGDGAAGVVTSFGHTITNLGNTTLQLKLTGASSLGSTVTFRSVNQSTFPLNPDGTFTLGTGTNGTFNFFVDVKVSQSALRGQQDLITISVLKDGTSLSGIQDTISVTRGAMFPRLYLPLAAKP